jgi:phosphoribosylformylglycinamidine cyclo-ligase
MPGTSEKPALSYASAGVDLHEKDSFTDSLGALVRRTFSPRVIQNPGGFAGLFRLDYNQRLFRRNYKEPVLVACADGVGTKLKLATQLGIYDTIGIDLVAMNVNDLVVQGAEPLFFLDYIAVPKVDKSILTDLVRGMVEGCNLAGCALLGGETAEMPDVYAKGDFDLAGFCVGVVELKRAIKPSWVRPGDVVLGLASSGIHSNGYSLVRKIVDHAALDLTKVYEDALPAPRSRRARRATTLTGSSGQSRADPTQAPHPARKPSKKGSPPPPSHPTSHIPHPTSLGHVLLTPTRIYCDHVARILRSYRVKNIVTGMAHITGSGLRENLVRSLPATCDALIDRAAWEIPPVFRFLQKHGNIPDDEMERVFNLGIGFCLIVKPAFAESVREQLEKLGETVYEIGKITKGKGIVRYAD